MVGEGLKTSETKSDKFEVEIKNNLEKFLSTQEEPLKSLEVSRYEGTDTKFYSDVKVTNPKTNKNVWIEVKENKYACFAGPSLKYKDGRWTCTTTDEDNNLTEFYEDAITKSSEKFISFCKDYLNTDDISIPKDLTPELIDAWKKSGSVDDTDNDVQFITDKIPLEGFGEKIAEYYKTAKYEPVYYMQVDDELYIIDSNYNPLGLRTRDGHDLKTLADAYRIGRIQFRAKGLEKKLKDETKYYYSIVCDVKILADKEKEEEEYKCSFKSEDKWPIVQTESTEQTQLTENKQPVTETRISTKDKLFFHGSRNSGILTHIKPPSPENIFYVTNDIDYAYEYTKMNQGEGPKGIYVVTLKDGIDIFDPFDEESFYGNRSPLVELWPVELRRQFTVGEKITRGHADMLSILYSLVCNYRILKKYDFDLENVYKNYDGMLDFNDLSDSLESIKFLLNRGDEFKKCFEMESARKGADGLRVLLAKDLLRLGFVGFRTAEMVQGQSSNKCYALFSPDAFQDFMVKPIDVKVAEKAIEALHDLEDYDPYYDPNNKNFKASNNIIDAFIQEYNKQEDGGKMSVNEDINQLFDRSVKVILEDWLPEYDNKPENQWGEKWTNLDSNHGIFHAVDEIARDCQADPDECHKEDSLRLSSVHKTEDGHYIVTLFGGCNGGGSPRKIITYLAVVKKFAKKLLERFGHVWLIDWSNDCADDVWTVRLAFTDLESEKREEEDAEIAAKLTELYSDEEPQQEFGVAGRAVEMLAGLIGGTPIHDNIHGFDVHSIDVNGDRYRFVIVRRMGDNLVVYKNDEPDEFFAFDSDLSSERFQQQKIDFIKKFSVEPLEERSKFEYRLPDKENAKKGQHYAFQNRSDTYGGDDYLNLIDIMNKIDSKEQNKYSWFAQKDAPARESCKVFIEVDDGKDSTYAVTGAKRDKEYNKYLVCATTSSDKNSALPVEKFIGSVFRASGLMYLYPHGNMFHFVFMNPGDEMVYVCNGLRLDGNDLILEMEPSTDYDYNPKLANIDLSEADVDIGGEKSDTVPQEGVKLWIDDIREAPKGFKWIKSVNEFIDYCCENGVGNISLYDTDHDAGDYQKDGGDYIRCFDYLDACGCDNITIHIHSANPVGANNIRRIITKNKEKGWKEIRNS